MIGIARGPEPAGLKTTRAYHLSRGILAWEANGAALPDDFAFKGYEIAKEALYQAQHQKCAYCETKGRLRYSPTEHFRPKDGAARDLGARPADGPTRWDPQRYWWLAWTWENLLYACPACNGVKANRFLLVGPPLPPLSLDLHREDVALVDPCRDEPLAHVQWAPSEATRRLERRHWEWQPVAVGAKGGGTISALGLLESDLSVLVTDELRRHVLPKVEAVERLVGSGDPLGAEAMWATLIAETLFDGAPYAAARWSALTYLQSPRGGSPLSTLPAPPRPGRHDPPTIPEGLPPAPAGIPEAAWLRLLAGEQLDDALVMILHAAPMTAGALHGLIRSPPTDCRWSLATLNARLSALISAGRLVNGPGETFSTP